MKASRIAVLVVAVAAAGGAFMLANGPKPAPAPVTAAPPSSPVTDDVLVASRDVSLGSVLTDADLAWQAWPKAGVAQGFVLRDANPKALDDFKGSIARENLHVGVPLRPDQVIKGANGFMSAILPSGRRAVAINVDATGATSAGGFILPNDHVDVIRLYTDDANKGPTGASPVVSETILRNIRVLAIGPNVQNKDGESVVNGTNVTLELDPVQSETVILAQRTGQLSLVLRSILDANATSDAVARSDGNVTVVRFGYAADGALR